MFKIQTLNAISDIIHTQLSAENYTVSKEEPVPDAILVRSAAMHEMIPKSTSFMSRPAGSFSTLSFLYT